MLTIYVLGYVVMFLTLLAISCAGFGNGELFLANLVCSALFAAFWPVLLPVMLLIRIVR